MEIIQLHDLRFVRELSESKIGALLQIDASELPISADEKEQIRIGLRCEVMISGRRTLGLVLLEGLAAGTFLDDHTLSNRGAFDVSELARVSLQDCRPHLRTDKYSIIAGDVCQTLGETGGLSFCMAIRLPGDAPSIMGHVELLGVSAGRVIAGDTHFRLGRAVVVPIG